MPSTADQENQFTRQALEAISLWSETNMQVLRQLLDCSASTAREGLNLSTELQTAAFEAATQGQSYMLRRLSELPDAPRNPLDYYQKSRRPVSIPPSRSTSSNWAIPRFSSALSR